MAKNYFVSVTDALSIIFRTIKSGHVKEILTSDATGYVLAKAIINPYPSPPFDQSAMDGYAFRFNDFKSGRKIVITGESAAGENFIGKIASGQSVRIFTGAAVPPGADTIVMQEKVELNNSAIIIRDDKLLKGANIRKAGSQLKKGIIAADKGVLFKPGAVGYIAGLGIKIVSVYSKPVVSVIVTGDELISPDQELGPGQIFESNSAALCSLLQNDGINNIKCFRVKDSLKSTGNIFRKALLQSDMILFTGGVSVGDYDFVIKTMESEKVKTGFYKVRQKPGKPLYFGIKEKKYVFGLPGNPASVLSCYYEYVRPAINAFQNNPHPAPVALSLPLASPVQKKVGLANYLKAYTDFKTVTPLSDQESYKMKSFISANCFIFLDEKTENKNINDLVEVHLF